MRIEISGAEIERVKNLRKNGWGAGSTDDSPVAGDSRYTSPFAI
jgi:hypothetical protein